MNFNMITKKHNRDNGYISLVNLKLRNAPDKIMVDGYELLKKGEFHISILALKHLASMLDAKDTESATNQLEQDFLDFSKTHNLTNFRLTGECRLVKRDERVTVVAMAELENIEELFEYLRDKHSVDFPTQPTHITMYTLQPEAGIGILSSGELIRDSVAANIPALADLEINNDKIDTVFFDWGGVVANDPGDDFLSQLLKDVGATDEQIETIFRTYMKRFMRGQIDEQEYWQEIKDSFGLSIPDTISEEFAKWNGLVANQDILDLVRELKEYGLKVAILSNVIEPTYNVLDKAGYYQLFDEVIASCKVGFAKPEKEIYQLSLVKLNTTAGRSLFIDDKQSNLDPAIQMGLKAILAKDPEQIVRDTRKLLEV